jgi:hypothetical protein
MLEEIWKVLPLHVSFLQEFVVDTARLTWLPIPIFDVAHG